MDKKFIFILLILILSLALYSNTLKNGFVYDDKLTITDNSFIKELNNFPKLFSKEYLMFSGETSYRPIVTGTYFIDYAIYGMEPWGYHLSNIILHAINGSLLYIFLYLIFLDYKSLSAPYMIATLLFVSHPVLTEAVNSISYREDLLTFLFYITTLILYLVVRNPLTFRQSTMLRGMLFIISSLSYFFSLLSKEMAMTLPLIIFCYEWFQLGNKRNLKSLLFNFYNFGYIVITLVYIYLRFYIFISPTQVYHDWTLTERLITVPWLMAKYLLHLILPISLSADYVIVPIGSIASIKFIIPCIIIFLLSFIMLMAGRKEKNIVLGWFFFLIMLIPVYNFYPLSIPFAERFLYLPAIGFVIVISSLLSLFYNSLGSKLKIRYVIFPIVAIVAINSFIVIHRNEIWRNEYALWEDTVKKMPRSYRARLNLGIAYSDKGYFDAAIVEYMKAIELNLGDPSAHNNLGLAYLNQNRINAAVNEFLTALRFRPNYKDAHFNLGMAYYMQDRLDEALNELLIFIRLKPDDATARYLLGNVYQKQGRLDMAKKEFMAAMQLKPDTVVSHEKLGVDFDSGWVDRLVTGDTGH